MGIGWKGRQEAGQGAQEGSSCSQLGTSRCALNQGWGRERRALRMCVEAKRRWLGVGNGKGRAWENAYMLGLGRGGDGGPSWIREHWGRNGFVWGAVVGKI